MLSIFGELTGIELIGAGLALLVVLVFSLSLHEFAHAYVAYKQGDFTPKEMGRVTLNPLAHIDPIGFLCCALFGFGWAKPVEINPIKFRNYRKGMFLTSIAGVTVNIILSFIGCGVFYICLRFLPLTNAFCYFIYYFGMFLYTINLALFIFNLLPIYPLDGFNCISALTKYDNKFVNFMRKYGTIILIVILIFGDVFLIKLINWIGMPMEMLWELIVF